MNLPKKTAGACLAMTLLLAGCSNANGPSASSSESSPAASPSATPGASSSASPGGSPASPPAGTQTSSPEGASSAPPSSSASNTPPPSASSPETSDPIMKEVLAMSTEEKVGQLILAGIAGTELDAQAKRMIEEDKIGGVILYSANVSDLKGTVSLVNAIKKDNAPNPAPILISVDQEGGRVSRLPDEYEKFPANAKVGKTGKAELAGTMGTLIGRSLLSAGFNMDFAPVLDVNSNPDNPVIGDRSFGATADLVRKLGLAEIGGLRVEGVIPVVKHFPGHGDTSVDSHLELPVVDKTPAQLAKLEWIPFRAAIKDGIEAVMVAHILYPKIDPDKPASLSAKIIGEELRGEMGYDGVVITDDLGMGAIAKHYPLAEATVDAINAGADILLVGHGYDNEHTAYSAVLKAVKSGKITEKRLNESAYRIMKLKRQYKLRDKAAPVPDLTALNKDIRTWLKQIG